MVQEEVASEEVKNKVYDKLYTSVGMLDYFSMEKAAHERARTRLAFKGGKRVPYVVKMSVFAPLIDRGECWLEDNFVMGMVQADVVVFDGLEQKRRFLESGKMVYVKH